LRRAKRISPRICRHTIHLWNPSLSRSKCLKRLRFLSFHRRWFHPKSSRLDARSQPSSGALTANRPADIGPRTRAQWAATQNNLGNALTALGERKSGTARLEEAIAACDLALTAFPASDYYASLCRANRDKALAGDGKEEITLNDPGPPSKN
jgi:hypothetical protein